MILIKLLIISLFLSITFSTRADEDLSAILAKTYKSNSTRTTFARQTLVRALSEGIINDHPDCFWYDVYNKDIANEIVKAFRYLYNNEIALVPFDTIVDETNAKWISKKQKIIVATDTDISIARFLSTRTCKLDPNYKWEGDSVLTENDCKQVIDCDYKNLLEYIEEHNITLSHENVLRNGLKKAEVPGSFDILSNIINPNQPQCL